MRIPPPSCSAAFPSAEGEMKQKSKKKGRAKKKRSRIRVNLTNCKYRSVEKCVRDLGWQVVDEEASDGDEMDGFGTME